MKKSNIFAIQSFCKPDVLLSVLFTMTLVNVLCCSLPNAGRVFRVHGSDGGTLPAGTAGHWRLLRGWGGYLPV